MTAARFAAVLGAAFIFSVVGLTVSVAVANHAGAPLWSLFGVAVFAPLSVSTIALLYLGLDEE